MKYFEDEQESKIIKTHRTTINDMITSVNEYEDGYFIGEIKNVPQKLNNKIIENTPEFRISADSFKSFNNCLDKLTKLYNKYLNEHSTIIQNKTFK